MPIYASGMVLFYSLHLIEAFLKEGSYWEIHLCFYRNELLIKSLIQNWIALLDVFFLCFRCIYLKYLILKSVVCLALVFS